MTPLAPALAGRCAQGRKLLVPYLMAGMVPDWMHALEAMAHAGADAVEVGIPFSDPIMDGPTIQAAAVRALEAGTTPPGVLEALARVDAAVPLVVMTYYNVVYRAGHRRAAQDMAASGVSGAILPDLPLEEIGPWAGEADAAGIATVMLVAPSSPPERVAQVSARSRGFLYAVGRMGVTGERRDVDDAVPRMVEGIRATSELPILVGVGVSTPDQAVQICRHADGVVVGSALVHRLLDGAGPDGAGALVGEIRRAIDGS